MNIEQLKKAKDLEHQINQYVNLLKSLGDGYYWCLVSVSGGSDNPERFGSIPRPILNKMIGVLEEEKKKLEEEFKSL